MQHTHKILLLATVVSLAACGGKKEGNAAVAEKKEQLAKLKESQAKTTADIAKLEAEIIKLDPASATPEKPKLVSVATVAPTTFTHYIDLQGKIEAVNISYVTPRGMPAQVRSLIVKKGDNVRKGQLLLQLDNAVAKQSVIAAEQGLQTIKTQLSFAKTIYQKQKNLWDQNIGTEVQLLTAKNTVESLEAQLNASEEQIKISRQQLGFSNVYADVSGYAEEVNVRVGETFTGMGQIKIVNTDNLKITTQIPENYLNKVKIGSKLKVVFPDINKTIYANVTVASGFINPDSRSFGIEARIPADKTLHPNQIALINIQDYSNDKALTIPVNTLQNDEKGKFVMVAVQQGNRLVAKKKMVSIGELYGDKLEVKSGLTEGDVVVVEGFQGLYEGQLLSTK